MVNMRLRTKFLLSLLAISAGLTSATLFIVRYSVQSQVRDSLQVDLQNSDQDLIRALTFSTTMRLTHSAALLANLPNVRALMTTRDAATIQDATADVWRQSGSDLLVFASGAGTVLGIQTGSPGFDRATAEALLTRSLVSRSNRDWWLGSGHLFQVWIQPIYLGTAAEGDRIGLLVLGYEVDQFAAKQFGGLAASEVAFYSGDTIIASTFAPAQQSALALQLRKTASDRPSLSQEVQLGNERYLASTLTLSPGSETPVSLSVLKSFDKATSFLTALNRVLLALRTHKHPGRKHSGVSDFPHVLRGHWKASCAECAHSITVTSIILSETTGGDEVAEVTAALSIECARTCRKR